MSGGNLYMEINNEENHKVLLMKYPPITSYQSYANLLSIILNDEESLPWTFNVLTQIQIAKGVNKEQFPVFSPKINARTWEQCPWVSCNKISRELIAKKWGSIIDFVIDCIDLDYYVTLNIDRFYIPLYDQYMKSHKWHDIFIFGYDMNKRLLYVADFFKNGKYSYQQVSFEHFKASHINYDILKFGDFLDGVITIKLIKGKIQFDISIIKTLLEDYLYSRNTEQRFKFQPLVYKEENIHGLSYYDILVEQLEETKRINAVGMDLRFYHVLFDHKNAILLLIKYLMEKQYFQSSTKAIELLKEYEEIKISSLIIRNAVLKYTINKDAKIIDRLLVRLSDLKSKEKSWLEKLLNSI
jgi:hypothetical protein